MALPAASVNVDEGVAEEEEEAGEHAQPSPQVRELSSAVSKATAVLNAKHPSSARLGAAAATALKRALLANGVKDSPFSPHGWHVLGLLHHRSKAHSKAISCINNALSGLVSLGGLPDSFMLNNLGEAYRSNGDAEAARKCYFRSIDAGRQPGVEESAEALAWNNLGLLELSIGETKHARDFATRALKIKPDFPQALQLLERCETMMATKSKPSISTTDSSATTIVQAEHQAPREKLPQ